MATSLCRERKISEARLGEGERTTHCENVCAFLLFAPAFFETAAAPASFLTAPRVEREAADLVVDAEMGGPSLPFAFALVLVLVLVVLLTSFLAGLDLTCGSESKSVAGFLALRER